MKRTRPVAAAVLVAAGLVPFGMPAAQAATLCGVSICYEFDPAQPGAALFGLPTVLAGSNTLQWDPPAFVATATGLTPVTTTSAIFQFTKIYQAGFANGGGAEIGSITLHESGDYQIIGTGTVNANLRLQVVDQINNDGGAGFPEVLAPQFNWNTSTPTGLSFANWHLIGSVNPAAAFTDTADVVDLQIQNVLQAFASGENYAFIQKKLTLTATVVPLPAGAWLFASAAGALAWFRRRRDV